jgi:hypothetical protein
VALWAIVVKMEQNMQIIYIIMIGIIALATLCLLYKAYQQDKSRGNFSVACLLVLLGMVVGAVAGSASFFLFYTTKANWYYFYGWCYSVTLLATIFCGLAMPLVYSKLRSLRN